MKHITKKLALLGAVMMILLAQLAVAAPVLLSGHDAENCSCCQEEPSQPKPCCEDATKQELTAEHDCKCFIAAPAEPKQNPPSTLTPSPHFEIDVDFAPLQPEIAVSRAIGSVQIPFSKAHPPNGPPAGVKTNRGPPSV